MVQAENIGLSFYAPTQTGSLLRNIRSTYCDDRISFIESHTDTQVTRTNQPALQICRTPQSTRSMHRARGNKVWVMCWLRGVTKSCSMNRANTRGPPRSLACCRRHRCLCIYLYTHKPQVGAKGKCVKSVTYTTITVHLYYRKKG